MNHRDKPWYFPDRLCFEFEADAGDYIMDDFGNAHFLTVDELFQQFIFLGED